MTYTILAILGFSCYAVGLATMWYIKKRSLDTKLMEKVNFYKGDLKAKADELEKDLKGLKNVKAGDMDDALKKIRNKIKKWM